jgi:MarR family transcriptional regulator, organic hydroperoxide resistance regulator
MSTSRQPRSARRQSYRKRSGFRLPATASRPALLERRSDSRFRQLVYDLLTISVRMETVRTYLARQIGITGPQYSVLVAIAQFQGAEGVSVSKVAEVLHVSGAFITAETRQLERVGLVIKAINPRDRRGVLLRLTPNGERQMIAISPAIMAINDKFFAPLTHREFRQFADSAAQLVSSSRQIMQLIETPNAEAFAGAAE